MPHCHGFKDDVEEIIGMSRLPVFVCYRVLLRDNTWCVFPIYDLLGVQRLTGRAVRPSILRCGSRVKTLSLGIKHPSEPDARSLSCMPYRGSGLLNTPWILLLSIGNTQTNIILAWLPSIFSLRAPPQFTASQLTAPYYQSLETSLSVSMPHTTSTFYSWCLTNHASLLI